jgi:hypothetical protein
VFTVNESVTDYHVNFFERFSINIHNTDIHTSRVTKGLETFEMKIYPNGTETEYKGYVCVSIEMLTSQQDTVDLYSEFVIITSDGSRYILNDVQFFNMTVHDKQDYNMTSLDEVMGETNKMLDSDGFLTITMNGSYVIHGQSTITTSHAKFNAQTHTSVAMSYTWTVCNLTYPINYCMLSGKTFAGLGVAEFYITLWPTGEDAYLVSVYSELANSQINIGQSVGARRRFELINSTTMDHGAFDQLCMSDMYEYEDIGPVLGAPENFNFDDFKNSVRQNCATIRFHVCINVQL